VKTQAVYDYLLGVWGKSTLAGQTDLTWLDSTDMAQRVHDDTGKYPALMGYDFMNYVDATEGDGRHQTEEAIAWDQRGGLVSFHWHWRIANGKFYTKETPSACRPAITARSTPTSTASRKSSSACRTPTCRCYGVRCTRLPAAGSGGAHRAKATSHCGATCTNA
jgi:hypothetical protein